MTRLTSPHGHRRRGVGAAVASAVAAAVLAGAGCSVPTETRPRLIDDGDVPFDLLGGAQVDAPTFDDALRLSPVTVQLVATLPSGDRRLVPAERWIPDPVNLSTVVGNLMAGGITPQERAQGLVNRVPALELRSVQRSEPPTATDDTHGVEATAAAGPMATVEVNAGFFDRFPTPEMERLAIGQIVLTITGYRPSGGGRTVTHVRFTVDGRVRQVPTADPSTPLADVVTADLYAGLKGSPAESQVVAGSDDG